MLQLCCWMYIRSTDALWCGHPRDHDNERGTHSSLPLPLDRVSRDRRLIASQLCPNNWVPSPSYGVPLRLAHNRKALVDSENGTGWDAPGTSEILMTYLIMLTLPVRFQLMGIDRVARPTGEAGSEPLAGEHFACRARVARGPPECSHFLRLTSGALLPIRTLTNPIDWLTIHRILKGYPTAEGRRSLRGGQWRARRATELFTVLADEEGQLQVSRRRRARYSH
jgi:hypothetical protein